MKVGFDARTLSIRGGSKKYSENIIQATGELVDEVKLYGENYGGFSRYIQSTPLRILWENVAFPIQSHIDDVDIFHGLKYAVPINSSVPTVVTIHDVLEFKQMNMKTSDEVYARIWRQYARSADHIIVPSHSTKDDVVELFSIAEENVSVVHHGVEAKYFNRSIDRSRLFDYLQSEGVSNIRNKKVILNTGTVRPRKNQTALIKSFTEIAKDNPDAVLLVAGKMGWRSDKITSVAEDSTISDRIHFLGFVPEDILVALYSYAEVFVYPSLAEGFGFPVLEAMASATPVITSNTTSLPEVVGDAGKTVDPENISEIRTAIAEVLNDATLQDQLAKEGRDRALEFSWSSAAKETVSIYEKLVTDS
ncbi:glycosyltransferase family 4 protein [Halosimplex halobium]|uniref:glycosyltransferase family 4 protein n=1 Tax=Halosimplex halobium TaxID=3396618 RepID=UPI003F570B38